MVLWMLLSMNMHGVDVAHTEFEWRGWMLLNMHAVDVAINEFFMHAVEVGLNEFACCGCCSQ